MNRGEYVGRMQVRVVLGFVERCQSAARLDVVIVCNRWFGGRLVMRILNCEVSFLMVSLIRGMAVR